MSQRAEPLSLRFLVRDAEREKHNGKKENNSAAAEGRAQRQTMGNRPQSWHNAPDHGRNRDRLRADFKGQSG